MWDFFNRKTRSSIKNIEPRLERLKERVQQLSDHQRETDEIFSAYRKVCGGPNIEILRKRESFFAFSETEREAKRCDLENKGFHLVRSTTAGTEIWAKE